jgi:predicted metal-dependent HD superfamily phosphohydrolase
MIHQNLEKKLRDDWFEKFGKSSTSTEAIDEIINSYRSEGRFYHDSAHVMAGLEEMKRAGLSTKTLYLAQLTHDFYYDVFASDANNVLNSAYYAQELALKLGLGKESAEESRGLVLVTDHKTQPEGFYQKVMIDIDLAVFGKDENAFFEYDKNIRKEYAHVPWEVFRKKRAIVLRGFLERDHIYNTPEFRERYQNKAKENLEKCITRLEDPSTADYLLFDQ